VFAFDSRGKRTIFSSVLELVSEKVWEGHGFQPCLPESSKTRALATEGTCSREFSFQFLPENA